VPFNEKSHLAEQDGLSRVTRRYRRATKTRPTGDDAQPVGPPLRVFQIGFNKCGTRTLHYFFRDNGWRTAHWRKGVLALAVYENLTYGRSLVTGFQNLEVFTDMEFVERHFVFEAYKLFPYFAEEFPNAVFILNTRDRDDWLQSRFNHSPGYVERWKAVIGAKTDGQLADWWLRDWDDHHERVRSFFRDRPQRLIEFDLATTPPEVIAQTIPERDFDLGKFAVRGKTHASTDEDDVDDVDDMDDEDDALDAAPESDPADREEALSSARTSAEPGRSADDDDAAG
jgi:hypothetical protein